MATTYTTNYNLGKQENHADKFDMDVITDNADKIDAALTVLQSGIDGKQAALTTEQLAAVNSGITSTDVAQITTNKNNISKCLALEGGTALTSTADLNNITTIGNYYCSSNTTGQTIANRPTGSSGAFRLTVYFDTGTQYPSQLFDDFSTRKKWERKGNGIGTTFESWALIIDNLEDYQKKLSSTTKANADYIDDTSSTHKFATAAQLSQIEINKNNIYSLQDITGSYRVLLSATPVNGIYFGVYNFPRPQSTTPAVTLTVGIGTQGGGVVDPTKFNTNVYEWGFRVYTTEASYAGLIIQVTVS